MYLLPILSLIFTDTDPICTSNVTSPLFPGQVVTYKCEVAYRGGLEPQMDWLGPHGLADSVLDESVPGELVKKTIIVTAGVENNGWAYKCRIYFNGPEDPGERYSMNAPTYEYNYTAPALDVLCKHMQLFPDLINTSSFIMFISVSNENQKKNI